MSDQPIPTPRHDKLLYEEACNFDVGWSEEYQKLERELVLKEQEKKGLQMKAAWLERKFLPCPDCRDKTQDGECLRCKCQTLQSERDQLRQAAGNVWTAIMVRSQPYIDTEALRPELEALNQALTRENGGKE